VRSSTLDPPPRILITGSSIRRRGLRETGRCWSECKRPAQGRRRRLFLSADQAAPLITDAASASARRRPDARNPPFLNISSVGIDMMPYLAAVFGFRRRSA